MHPLERVMSKKEKIAAGLISGTSVDGVDSAIIRIKGKDLNLKIELIHFLTHPYPADIRLKIEQLIKNKSASLKDIAFLQFKVGEIFADALIQLCKKSKIPLKQIDFVGSHGQTVWHSPPEKDKKGSTLQIGDGDVIKERTGITTVSDFRVSDMAAGGEGAPLVPLVDYILFRNKIESRGLLNIGGISNITVIPEKATINDVFAFDCGPGNTLIDLSAQLLFNQKIDYDGKLALSGKVNQKLLNELMNHPFILKKPPKSTGRETFDLSYCKDIIKKGKKLNLSRNDIIATISEFTAKSIFYNYENFIAPVVNLKRIILSGGGAFNRYLYHSLKNYFKNIIIEKSDIYNIPAEAKEAVAFAVLAYQAVMGRTSNLPGVTGAKKRVVCGKISLTNR
ncbi:anhydro-N-acetylmuramic acid kinase [candidate division KSB1 bacterium]|nr:MAG: anhydro-N-acetylmuramic acid kinase [candidate division KSB1 bacterium]